MPYQSVTLKPGIDIEQTPVLNSAGWSSGAYVRFFEGMLQKLGGWYHINQTPIIGTARAMHAWADLGGTPYIAIGSEQRLALYYGGTLDDITPLLATTTASPDLSTTSTSKSVKVTSTSNGAEVGDWIYIEVPVSIGGIVVQGYYQVATVVDANDFTFLAASAATSTVNNGGAVPNFAITNTSKTITVTLANHGLAQGGTFTVQVATTVGNITIGTGIYSVASVTNSSVFTFTQGTAATSSTNAYENGGDATIEYLLHTGAVSASYTTNSGGYGLGGYGAGQYGGSQSSSVLTQLSYWSLSNFGQDLIASRNGGPLYVWTPPLSTNPQAIQLDTANYPSAAEPPVTVGYSFAAAQQQMIICLGVDNPLTMTYDPNLVRWCDAGDFTDWEATTVNLAGSFRIPSGSMLIAGVSTGNFNVLWTDVDMWLMSFLGAPLVWGFQKIADAVDIIGPLAAGTFRNTVIWPSREGFYMYDGAAVRQLNCPVWDAFWYNLNSTQAFKVNAQVNSFFGEISWGFPSASGSGEVDSRITYNIREDSWTVDIAPTLTARVAWIDENVYTHTPVGVDLSNNLQQHESTNDADGLAMPSTATSGWFALSETDYNIMVERMMADFIVTGGNQTVSISFQFQNYPTGPVTTCGPYSWVAGGTGPPYSIVRGRGRLARIIVQSNSTGTFWRLGRVRLQVQPTGRAGN